MGKDNWKAPTFRLTETLQCATTYKFTVDRPLGGWAICTVNDATGELVITSDFGNWANRWGTHHLGGSPPHTLTSFIAKRNSSWTDTDGTVIYDGYLADKLCGHTDGREFDDQATADALCHLIAERRLEDGRDARRGITNLTNHGKRLDAETAREIYNAIQGLTGSVSGRSEASADLFLEYLFHVLKEHDAHEFRLLEEPWNHLEYRATYPYRVLREAILPALIAACKVTCAERGESPAAEAVS